jgi:hypothetical protein
VYVASYMVSVALPIFPTDNVVKLIQVYTVRPVACASLSGCGSKCTVCALRVGSKGLAGDRKPTKGLQWA